jgi:hypothetical protein
MFRRCTLIVVTAAALFAAATPASATTPPPTGSLVCDLSGHTTFRPAVPSAPGSTDVKMKSTSTASNCDVSEVTGGKAVINGGAVTITATLPKGTASCSNWATKAVQLTKIKVTVKLQHLVTSATGKVTATTVATVRPVITTGNSIVINDGAAIEMYGSVPQNRANTAAFGNDHVAVVLNSTDNVSVTCASGAGSMSVLTFTADDFSDAALYLNAS